MRRAQLLFSFTDFCPWEYNRRIRFTANERGSDRGGTPTIASLVLSNGVDGGVVLGSSLFTQCALFHKGRLPHAECH